MIDPRSDELEVYLESLTSAWERAAIMHTLAFAFPYLRACEEWMGRIATLEGAMNLNRQERTGLLVTAAGMAEDLMALTRPKPH